MTTTKDTRKVYKNHRIEITGNVITFDGKLNPTSNTLKIYRLNGDVSRFDEAIEQFCTGNGIENVIVKVWYPSKMLKPLKRATH